MALNHEKENEKIMISPKARDPFEIPEVSFPDYLLRHLNANLPRLRGKPWLVNVDTGLEVKFDEVENMSRRVASALARRGFKRGDTLYFVTFESVRIYVILLAVWRLGGCIQGWFQRDKAEKVEINPREDVAFICYTSGSTGDPKGALHSHYAAIAGIHAEIFDLSCENSMMIFTSNFSMMVTFAPRMLIVGGTLYCFSKLDGDNYFDTILKYKPDTLLLYPYVAAMLARSPQMKSSNMDFLKRLICGAAALDFGTVRLLQQIQPHIIVQQIIIWSLLIVDLENGRSLDIGERGNVCVKSPTIMKGYNVPSQKSNIDADGWLHTADLGFLDAEGNLFLLERLSFTIHHRLDLTNENARAYVVLRPDHRASADELKKFVAARLPHSNHLHGGLRFLDALPLNRNGKLDRLKLREISKTELSQKTEP
ncbi:hypothetical protein B566_EDAN016943 [Ephemera danica]|nr:hypothetical protein B566_EDAN016943 [Ephemera danica]